MAGRFAAKVASLALLFAAPLVQASNGTARSCALCWETASNQAISPFCTGISGDAAKAECLCSAGNKAIFNLCEKACAGLDRAPSNVCAKVAGIAHAEDTQVAGRANDGTCGACWNAEIAQRCPGISNSFEQQLCLCSPHNAGSFVSTCDSACANSIVKPSDACHVSSKRESLADSLKSASRSDDQTCGDCWNSELAQRCPGVANPYERQLCLCDPYNAGDFITKCESACANSLITPSDTCRILERVDPTKRAAQGESILPWKHGDDDDKKRSAQGESILPWKHEYDDEKKTSEKVHRPKPFWDCFPLPGLACHNTADHDAAQ